MASMARRMTAMAPMVRRIKLGSQGLEVSAQGLDCRHISNELDMIKLIHHAVHSGVTFLDTSDSYGPHINETLLGKALKGGVRQQVELATKFRINFEEGKSDTQGNPRYVRAACEASLKRLDVDCIDLYYQEDNNTHLPIEVTIGEMKKLIDEGKIKYLGLKNASLSTIRRAHAVHPLTAVQLDWALATRDEGAEIVLTCRELGIGVVAHNCFEDFSEHDYAWHDKQFLEEILAHDSKVLNEISQRKGCTRSQLALAWLHHKGDDVCPIPPMAEIENFNQNIAALSVKLTPEEMAELESTAAVLYVKCWHDVRSMLQIRLGMTPRE